MAANGFGRPQPLPGQAGHGTRESDRLEAEASQMASHLQALRNQMSREKEKRESAGAKVGGAKWRSGRSDRGSVSRNYAREIKAKNNQRVAAARAGAAFEATTTRRGAGAAQQPPPPPQPQPQPQPQHHQPEQRPPPPTQDVHAWLVSDTSAWLAALGLAQYCAVFEQNEISGLVLLEVGLEDLDYMQVRVLAHRKLLLKGIEDLKRNGVPTIAAPPAVAPTQPAAAAATSTPAAGALGEARAGERVHWSQVKPLSENQVSNLGGGVPVNLADGEYDEAAAQREFQEAVLAWRNGGAASAPAASAAQHPETEEPPAADDGMWRNPWAAEADDAGTTPMDADEGGPATGAATATATATGGGALLGGELDEEKEHEDFARAVAAWRRGGTGGGGEGGEGGEAVGGVAVGGEGQLGPSGAEVAEALAKRLDDGYHAGAATLADQRRRANEALAQKEAELGESRRRVAAIRADAWRGDAGKEGGDEPGGPAAADDPYDSDPPMSVASTPPDSPRADDVRLVSVSGDVDVALVESTMWDAASPTRPASAACVVVEPPSDEEEEEEKGSGDGGKADN